MKLVKTAFFSGLITFIRIASGFLSNKVVAVYTGPAGVALVGAFSNFIVIVLTFANGAINNGVIKYTAEYSEDKQELKKLFSTSLKISISCSLAVGGVLLLFAPFFTQLIFTNQLFVNIIRVLGCTIVFYSLNSLLISILNGKGQIRDFTIVNMSGSILGLLITLILVVYYKIEGALYALVLVQSIVFFVSLFLITKSEWFSLPFFRESFDKVIAIKLSHYTLMAVVTALTVPVSQIILRNLLIKSIGINDAGIWQGLMKISDGYLMVVTIALGTYYLPKLSTLKTDSELRAEILQGYKIIIPIVLVTCILIYFLRFFLIKVLYTPDFNKMEGLFIWQLIGDFFKIAAYILAYLMLSKTMTKAFVITEILFSVLYIMFSYYFIDLFGLIGVTISFALNYFIYFLVMLIIFNKIIFTRH